MPHTCRGVPSTPTSCFPFHSSSSIPWSLESSHSSFRTSVTAAPVSSTKSAAWFRIWPWILYAGIGLTGQMPILSAIPTSPSNTWPGVLRVVSFPVALVLGPCTHVQRDPPCHSGKTKLVIGYRDAAFPLQDSLGRARACLGPRGWNLLEAGGVALRSLVSTFSKSSIIACIISIIVSCLDCATAATQSSFFLLLEGPNGNMPARRTARVDQVRFHFKGSSDSFINRLGPLLFDAECNLLTIQLFEVMSQS